MKQMGGARPGAGRPKGITSKITQEAIEKAQAGGLMPLDILLNDMRYHYNFAEQELKEIRNLPPTEEAMRRVKVALEFKVIARHCAESAAPYLHPKLSSVEANVSVSTHEAALAELE